ncbi:MarR family transcriptional regulator [Brevibacillus sp. SYP-B805]|uniref:MarR family transcriptional regulator n=1 Tax=Brevibacillus sp. SYP-B805 TaxID=1578199 RepID=UPI0013EB00D5|nr:MarR family transcriptional regulator [Brevibacillus sp. SYP-B805]NGQ96765.1 MarR family transcriptional regulator [Brevibacillus sp. SYP-B805]
MADLTKELIYEMYVRLLHLNEQKADTDLQEFFQQATGDQLKLLPKNMTSIHVIDCIGHHEPINNIAIAKKMNLSKANVTKITSKLLEADLIKRFQLTDNKKEVYFRLTPKGKQVFDMHAAIHKRKEEQFYRFLDQYTETEQHAILKFLRDMTIRIAEELAERQGMVDEER